MKWISVKERLPDKEGNYLVCCTSAGIARWCENFSPDKPEQWLDFDYISYWMPWPDGPPANQHFEGCEYMSVYFQTSCGHRYCKITDFDEECWKRSNPDAGEIVPFWECVPLCPQSPDINYDASVNEHPELKKMIQERTRDRSES